MPTYYWSRVPGKFINKETGCQVEWTVTEKKGKFFLDSMPRWSGSVRGWYETLVETCHSLHIETNREANAIIVSSGILTLLEQSCVYKPCFGNDVNEQNFFLAKVGYLPSMGLSVYQDGNDNLIHLVHIDKKTSSIEDIAQLKILDLHII